MERFVADFEVEVESVIKLMEDNVKLDGEGVEEVKEDKQLMAEGYLSGTTEKVEGEMPTSATGIFSAELWEPILNLLEDSEDIINVLRAFPELDGLFHSQKAYWLFDQVFPHLMTKHLTVKKTGGDDHNWTYSRDMLQLRCVSKRWKKVVEKSLEDHPDRHPTSLAPKPVKTTKPVALSENHFNFQRMYRYNLGATLLQSHKQIDQFLKDMRHLTEDQNPFPGKSVVIKPDIQWYSISLALLHKAVKLFQKFGKHVVTLEISIWDRMTSDSNLPLCEAVLDCLSHLPNLQSLTLKGGLKGGEYAAEVNDKFGNPQNQNLFPDLPSLKSFACQVRYKDKFSVWINGLFEAYGRKNGLRKLGIQHDKYWTSYLSSSLSCLTELHLYVDYDCSPNLGKIENVLRSLPNVRILKKLGLSNVPLPAIGDEPVNITKLIAMLAEGDFQVESLILENLVLVEEPPEADNGMTLSSIKSLCLQDDKKLSYHFLKMLPNLRWLTVYMQLEDNEFTQDYEGNLGRWELNGEIGTDFAKSLRKYLLQAKYGILSERQDFGGIWRGLPPKLEMISGSVEQAFRNVVDVQFVKDWGNQAFLGMQLQEDEEGQVGGGGDGEGCVVA